MAGYRLYLMDHHGHIRRAVEMECDDDGGAVHEAEEISGIVRAELWQAARLVKRFEAPVAEPQPQAQAQAHAQAQDRSADRRHG